MSRLISDKYREVQQQYLARFTQLKAKQSCRRYRSESILCSDWNLISNRYDAGCITDEML